MFMGSCGFHICPCLDLRLGMKRDYLGTVKR
jgi:hypothetical protein